MESTRPRTWRNANAWQSKNWSSSRVGWGRRMPPWIGAAMYLPDSLIHLEDMFAPVGWVSDQTPVAKIDDEVELLQGNLPNEHRHGVVYLHHVRRTVSV